MKGIRRVIYRLPDIVGGPAEATIYVEEGEKDVEALRSLGVLTTCNPGGVGKFTRDLTDPLKGRHVVIIADRDEPGRFDAEQVAATP